MKDDKWYRLHGIELPGSEESKSKNEDNLTDSMNQCNEIEKKLHTITDSQTIDVIIDIYNGKYTNYADYRSKYHAALKEINESNKIMANTDKLSGYYYVPPLMIRKEVFDYVMKKRGEKDNAN